MKSDNLKLTVGHPSITKNYFRQRARYVHISQSNVRETLKDNFTFNGRKTDFTDRENYHPLQWT